MTKIRLSRFGSKKNPHYRIVVTDSRNKRDGAYLERLGYYDPRKTTPDWLKVDGERAKYWLGVGAQPTETVRKLFKQAGVL
ncbi:30S ribosomal protein S16 [Calidithermus timidus]|jgi:small subunit ribosomal protein S16|uniref:30S ribosomal protein S16 n=1 Tax=Calidithermus timidus TaxID=307124 RepID=UPI000373F1C9|nr:30S ribosomal protein S16 [Calidithermus timidus]